jgi:hypothetical protein
VVTNGLLRNKKLNEVILKIDFKKAYDKVKWYFLQQTLRMESFYNEYGVLIHSFVSGSSVAIKVNNDIGNNYHIKKGYGKATYYHQCYLI